MKLLMIVMCRSNHVTMRHIFTIEGDPVGKGRPRFTRSGRAYTPKRTKDYEAKVRQAYIDSGGPDFGEQPVSMIITANFGMPKSWTKKQKRSSVGKYAANKVDVDNICKSVMDALLNVSYADDRQVVVCTASKWWAEKGSVQVEIESISEVE